jgi:hypothetical protein
MTDAVNIELVGADSYNTLTKGYKKGEVYSVSHEDWETLRSKTAPLGARLFKETTAPKTVGLTPKTAITIAHTEEAGPNSGDLSTADLGNLTDEQRAGLAPAGTGEIDTGLTEGNDEGADEGAKASGSEPSEAADKPVVLKSTIIRSGQRNAALKAALPTPAIPATDADNVQV